MPSTHPYPADYGMPEPTVPRLLQRADALINGERRQMYGEPSESFARIADLWTAYLGTEVTPKDYLNMMILMKVSRVKSGYHDDSYVDIAGYAGLTELL